MSRSHLRLDLEEMREGYTSVIHNSPLLAVLTSPDFMKEVNFHQRIATFGKINPAYDWTDTDIMRNDFFGSSELSLPYISNGYYAESYTCSSTDCEVPTELEDLGKQIKKETSPEPTSDKELTDREYEERLKIERRRMKNREAAHRCRRKKMEKIAELEGQVRALQMENTRIMENIKRLEKEASYLRTLCQQQNHCTRCATLVDL